MGELGKEEGVSVNNQIQMINDKDTTPRITKIPASTPEISSQH